MKIKVCGMRNADNIHDVTALGVDFIGLVFNKQSERYVSSINSHAGIIPDRANGEIVESNTPAAQFVGVFVDEMMQNVVTASYNYRLDFVQLQGDEGVTYIDNLRRTLDPDIRKGVKIIKTIRVSSKEDFKKTAEYEGHVDFFIFESKGGKDDDSAEKFDWNILESYKGDIPFFLSGGIGSEDAERVSAFYHPKFMGINVNSRFETEPGIKDVGRLKTFVEQLKN